MRPRLRFLGAADTVTGSRTLVESSEGRFLVDCGLFQGDASFRERNWRGLGDDATMLDAVILTHAHLDHSGYLPRLVRDGFRRKAYCTQGTADLCRILLRDAAHLEEETAAYANESGYSRHRPAEPLFTRDDAELALERLAPMPRHEWSPLAPRLSLRFLRAGHIVGASMAQIACETPDGMTTVTFSGDLGNGRSVIMRPPETGFDTDVLVLESTYGDRVQPRGDPLEPLAAVVRRVFARDGVLVVPAFAVGRAQELTYMLRLLEDQGRIPTMPVVLDSPMAEAAMEICLQHPEDHGLDSVFLGEGEVFKPRRFEVSRTPDDSMLACMREGPMIVISASGMLNGGRILHHLKHRLPDERNTVLFTGYQAEGTKGRFLQDNAERIDSLRIHHRPVAVRAEVATLDHLSAHADRDDLLEWVGRLRRLPRRIVVNHGAPAAQAALAKALRERFGIEATTAEETRELVL